MRTLKLDKIENESVVNNVVDQITALIINKEFVSGDKIPTEIELSEKLGVSRNSIREATKILRTMGLLEVHRGKGTFVTTTISPSFFDPLIFSLILEPKSNKDLYEFRMMFDTMVLFCAIDKITDKQIKKLKEMINHTSKRYEKYQDNLEFEFYIEQDIQFHSYLLEISNNPLIQRIGYSILKFIPEYIRKSITQKNGILRSIRNHKEIINVLEKNEKSNIVDIIQNTLQEWKNNWVDE